MRTERYGLQVRATLVHLSQLQPSYPVFTYKLEIKCKHCGEVADNESWLQINKPARNTNGAFHLVQKCKACDEPGNIRMVEVEGYLMVFVCNGIEPIDFNLGSCYWKAMTNEGRILDKIDLSDGEDFHEYHVETGKSYSINNPQAIFQKLQ